MDLDTLRETLAAHIAGDWLDDDVEAVRQSLEQLGAMTAQLRALDLTGVEPLAHPPLELERD